MSDDSRLLSTSLVIVDESGLDLTEHLSTISEEELGYTVIEDPDLAVNMDQFKSPLVDMDPLESQFVDMDPIIECLSVNMVSLECSSKDMDPLIECLSVDMDPIGSTSVDIDPLAYTVIETDPIVIDLDTENVASDVEICEDEDVIKIETSLLSEQEEELNNLVTFLVENSDTESENEDAIMSNIDNFPQDVTIVDPQSIRSTVLVENSLSDHCVMLNSYDNNEIIVLDADEEILVESSDSDETETMEYGNFVLIDYPANNSTVLDSVDNLNSDTNTVISTLEIVGKGKVKKRNLNEISDENETPCKKPQKVVINKTKKSLAASRSKILNTNLEYMKTSFNKKVQIKTERTFKCPFCNMYFPYKSLMLEHRTEHNHNEMIPKNLNSINQLQEIVTKKLSCCPICNSSYLKHIYAKDHIKHMHPKLNNINTRSRIYEKNQNIIKCKICAKLSVEKYLYSHYKFVCHLKRVHSIKFLPKTKNINAYVCSICDKHYMVYKELMLHFKSVHVNNELKISKINVIRKIVKVIKCDYCFKYFFKSTDLEHHVRMQHKSNRPIPKRNVVKMPKKNEKSVDKSKLPIDLIPSTSVKSQKTKLLNIKSKVKSKTKNIVLEKKNVPKKRVDKNKLPIDLIPSTSVKNQKQKLLNGKAKVKNKTKNIVKAKRKVNKKIMIKRCNKRKIPSYKCDMFFSSPITLKHHLFWNHTVKDLAKSNETKYVTKEPKFLCEICSEMFFYKELLTIHLKKTHIAKEKNTTNKNRGKIQTFFNTTDNTLNSKENVSSNTLQCTTKSPTTIITYEHSYTKMEDDIDTSMKITCEKSSDVKPFSCMYCDQKFKRKICVKLHINRIHLHTDIPLNCIKKNEKGKSIYECFKCNISFTNKKLFRKHDYDTHQEHNIFKYNCTLCELKFNNETFFDKHKTDAHNSYKCKTCNCLISKSKITTHYKTHILEEENKNREKNHCNYFLDRHVEIIKKNDLNYNVSYGNKCTNSKLTLLYTCNICEEKYLTSDDFKIHFEHVHKINSIQILTNKSIENKTCYRCKKCNYICDTQKLMYVHGLKYNHFGEIFNVCTICNKLFVLNNELMQHSKEIHNDDKPFKCKICNCEFSIKSSLFWHIKQKHGNKMINCRHCKNNIHDQRFINIHLPHFYEKLKIFNKQCPMCTKSFSNSTAMVNHVKNHSSGNNPKYYCDICVNFFYTKYNLNLHIKNEHEKCAFTCDYCLIQFKFKLALKKHIVKCHIEDEKWQNLKRKCPFCNKKRLGIKKHVLRVHADLFDKNEFY